MEYKEKKINAFPAKRLPIIFGFIFTALTGCNRNDEVAFVNRTPHVVRLQKITYSGKDVDLRGENIAASSSRNVNTSPPTVLIGLKNDPDTYLHVYAQFCSGKECSQKTEILSCKLHVELPEKGKCYYHAWILSKKEMKCVCDQIDSD